MTPDEELVSNIDSEKKTGGKKADRQDAERQAKVDQLRDLQIEEATQRADERKRKAGDRKAKEKAYQDSLKDQNRQKTLQTEMCSHRKGGKISANVKMSEALLNGNEPNYAVVKHIMPTGKMLVVCQRCPKRWEAPDPALAKSKDPDVRADYKDALKEYQWACRLPTDNETSGTHMFLIQENAAA